MMLSPVPIEPPVIARLRELSRRNTKNVYLSPLILAALLDENEVLRGQRDDARALAELRAAAGVYAWDQVDRARGGRAA